MKVTIVTLVTVVTLVPYKPIGDEWIKLTPIFCNISRTQTIVKVSTQTTRGKPCKQTGI